MILNPKSIPGLLLFLMFNKIFIAVILFFIGAYFTLPAPLFFPKEKTFEIRAGMTLADIAEKLDDENIIRSEKFFKLFVRLFKNERSVKAGLYYFERPLGLIEIANRLTEGKNGIGFDAITVREGQNLRDIGFIFENKGMFMAEEIWEVAGFPAVDYRTAKDPPPLRDFSSEFPALADKPAYVGLEGYLFPDTYFFPPNIRPEQVIRVMLENFENKLTPELREKISRQDKTIFEIITVASIIEREANETEDRKIISGILWKRADANMPMQADATLNYLTVKKSSELTVDDLAINSSYNTYKYPGLPLGPISNPGLGSINAAIYPQESPYWYYLHDSDGNPHYAKTFEEHKVNKEKYLK